jgi:uncharacterized membrane protein
MTLSALLRILGLASFVISLLILAAAFGTIGSFGTGLFFAVLGLALWLTSLVVGDFGRDRNL